MRQAWTHWRTGICWDLIQMLAISLASQSELCAGGWSDNPCGSWNVVCCWCRVMWLLKWNVLYGWKRKWRRGWGEMELWWRFSEMILTNSTSRSLHIWWKGDMITLPCWSSDQTSLTSAFLACSRSTAWLKECCMLDRCCLRLLFPLLSCSVISHNLWCYYIRSSPSSWEVLSW